MRSPSSGTLIIGATAVGTAVSTGSLSLIGFGINAVVDSSVSVLLVWRFHAEDRGHAERAERAEARAERLAGVAFLLIAFYLTVQSIRTLATSGNSESTTFGIVVAAAALVVLPFLARAKYTLALRIGSRALRADSILTASGVALSAVALIALAAAQRLRLVVGRPARRTRDRRDPRLARSVDPTSAGEVVELYLRVWIKHGPNAEVDLQLRPIGGSGGGIEFHDCRSTHDRVLAQAPKERGQAFGVGRIADEELHSGWCCQSIVALYRSRGTPRTR